MCARDEAMPEKVSCTSPAIAANDLRVRLYQFADDSMMGREAGTLGGWKATEYVAREYRRLGLLPGGENGTYFQEIQYGRLRYDSMKVQLAAGGTPLVLMTDWVPISPSGPMQVTGKFAGQNVGVIFGGRWMDSTVTLDPAVVRGKVVVFLPAAPTTGTRPAGTPAPRDVRAQQGGAAAIVLINEQLSRTSITSRTAMMPVISGQAAGFMMTPAAAARLFDRPLDPPTVGAAGRTVSGAWTSEYTAPEFGTHRHRDFPGSASVSGQYVDGAHNDHSDGPGAVRRRRLLRASTRCFAAGANDRVASMPSRPRGGRGQ